MPLDQISLLDDYWSIWRGENIRYDEENLIISELLLTGLVKVRGDFLVTRNRIYHHLFDQQWIERIRPVAEVEMQEGTRVRIRSNCSIGRTQSKRYLFAESKGFTSSCHDSERIQPGIVAHRFRQSQRHPDQWFKGNQADAPQASGSDSDWPFYAHLSPTRGRAPGTR